MYGKRLEEISKIDLEKITVEGLFRLEKELGKKKIVALTTFIIESAVVAIIAGKLSGLCANDSEYFIDYLKNFVKYLLEGVPSLIILEAFINGLNSFFKARKIDSNVKEEIERRLFGKGEDEITKQ